MAIPLAEYQEMLGEARGHQLVHYEDFEQDGENDQLDQYAADHDANPAEILSEDAFRDTLIAGIQPCRNGKNWSWPCITTKN